MNLATLIYFCAMLAAQDPTKIMDSNQNIHGKAYLINYQSKCECFNQVLQSKPVETAYQLCF